MHRPYNKQRIDDVFAKLKNINNTDSPPLSKGGLRGGWIEKSGTEGRLDNKVEVMGGFEFGTDIIVGFPTESDTDFQETYDLCQSLGFSKIHVFKYSPRPDTPARDLFLKSEKISKKVLLDRSKKLRNLTKQ
jgi:coproporphyrinogen III oxidase-like Fe-S oxidoreductase